MLTAPPLPPGSSGPPPDRPPPDRPPADRPPPAQPRRFSAWRGADGRRNRGLAALALFGISLAAMLGLSPYLSVEREAIVLPLVLAFVALVLRGPRTAIPLLFAWLILLGMFRRMLSDSIGSFGGKDPLLVVAPITVLFLFGLAARRGALRNRTTMSNAFLILMLLAIAGCVNPLGGGGFSKGVNGAFYVVLPMLWFWIGRGFADEKMIARIFRIFIGLAIPICIYGLLQTSGYLLPFDQAWITYLSKTFSSLYVNGALRAFGTFTSGQEYGGLLAVAIVLIVARFLSKDSRRPSPLLLPVVPLLAVGLFLASLREVAFLAVIAIGALVGARRRVGLTRMGLYGLGAAMTVILLAGSLSGGGGGGGGAGATALANHEASGLSNPFGSHSSGGGHVTEIFKAWAQGFRNPVGYGTGSAGKGNTTVSSAGGQTTRVKLKGAQKATASAPTDIQTSSDSDPGNSVIYWGFPGLIAYLVFVYTSMRRGLVLARERRSWVSFGVLGVAIAVSLRWFAELYSLIPLVWLGLGWLDRETAGMIKPRGSTSPKRQRVAAGATAY